MDAGRHVKVGEVPDERADERQANNGVGIRIFTVGDANQDHQKMGDRNVFLYQETQNQYQSLEPVSQNQLHGAVRRDATVTEVIIEGSRDGENKGKKGEKSKSEAEQRRKKDCLLYTSPSPRDRQKSRMPSSA